MHLTAILVRTHNPGNLGSAARVCKNFAQKLALMKPQTERSHPDALAFASGAEDTLFSAPCYNEWDALGQAHDWLIALTSERGRGTAGLPPLFPLEDLRRELSRRESPALVFGPERSGLTTEEILRCQARLTLPTDPGFPTLNLAQAVAVALALLTVPPEREALAQTDSSGPAALPKMNALETTLRDILTEAAFPIRKARPDVIDELNGFIKRACPSNREADLLLGALAAIEKRLWPGGRSPRGG